MILSGRPAWQNAELTPYLWAVVVGVVIGAVSFVSPAIAVVLVATILVVLAALYKPVILLFLYSLAVIFLSGMPRGFLVPVFVPNEPILILVIALGGITVLVSNAGRQDTERISPAVIVGITLYFIGTAILPTVIYLIRGWRLGFQQILALVAPVQYLLLFWLGANLPRSEEERLELLHFLIFCSSIVSVTALLQAVNFGPMMDILQRFYPSVQFDTAAESGRVTSILNAWNSLGNFLMITIVLILSVANLKRGRLFNVNLVVGMVLNVAGLLASGSFASIAGLLITLVIVKYFDRRGMKLLGALAVLAIVAIVVLFPLISERLDYQFGGAESSGTPQTLNHRFYLWETIFFPALAKNNNFLWGITPVLNTGVFRWDWAENQYLYLLIRSGVISLIAHLAWTGITLAWLWRIRREGQDNQRTLALAVFALLVTLTIMGMTNEVFTNSGSMDYFWMLLGIAAKGGAQRQAALDKSPKLRLMPVRRGEFLQGT